jgi:hypothetical protein
MNREKRIRILVLLLFALITCGAVRAQTGDSTITVKIVPATTVEEKVANEEKEKALRKAAEEENAKREVARIAETNPKTLLSRARVLYIDSNTTYFESVQLQNALRKREETDRWQLAMVDGGYKQRDIADIIIEIDRPVFTFTYTYKIIDRSTSIVLATGKVNAFDANAAAPMLAERIVDEMRKARGEVKTKK